MTILTHSNARSVAQKVLDTATRGDAGLHRKSAWEDRFEPCAT